MKTTKVFTLLSVVLIAFLAISYSPSGKANDAIKKSVNITLAEAVESPGLVAEMYRQLNEDFLLRNQQSYTQKVVYQMTNFYITGSHTGWTEFFKQRVTFWSSEGDY